MRVGIICAGDEELAPFLPLIEDCSMTEKAGLKFYEGKIQGMEVIALFSGVCKVNAAIASQLLIDVFGVDAMINAGTLRYILFLPHFNYTEKHLSLQ